MHILSVRLFNTNNTPEPVLLAQAEDLSTVPFLARLSGSVSETLLFLSRTFASRSPRGARQGCREGEYTGWIYHRPDGLAGVVICDQEYDRRVAFGLVHKYMGIYEEANWAWSTYDEDSTRREPSLERLLATYQKPMDADAIAKINHDLEATRVTLHKSVDALLERGEKIDTMVDKSADLSKQAKKFYKKSKKLNSWCGSCAIS